ncbi:MAG TPA: DUF3558 family protein [Amycolatopsis sp.]|nr:DUF3558 family protein [Amycolatopsis sp.]
MRSRWPAVAVLVLAGLTASCTTQISGTPLPGRVTVAPAPSTDPCALMTVDEAAELGFGRGQPDPGKPESRIPPSCTWKSADPDASLDDSIQVFYATKLNIGEYYSHPPEGQEQMGGITWQKYPSFFPDEMCDFAIVLSDTSFVAVAGQNFADSTKTCDVARKVAPVVARHLPR